MPTETDEKGLSEAPLTPREVWLMLDELKHRWRKYRYARNRMETAREEAEEVIKSIYPHVSGGVLAEMTGLTRQRIWQIARDYKGPGGDA